MAQISSHLTHMSDRIIADDGMERLDVRHSLRLASLYVGWSWRHFPLDCFLVVVGVPSCQYVPFKIRYTIGNGTIEEDYCAYESKLDEAIGATGH